MHMSVIELSNLFDTRHEAGKLLELRPLVVYRADRTIHLDNLLYSCHCSLRFALPGVLYVSCHEQLIAVRCIEIAGRRGSCTACRCPQQSPGLAGQLRSRYPISAELFDGIAQIMRFSISRCVRLG